MWRAYVPGNTCRRANDPPVINSADLLLDTRSAWATAGWINLTDDASFQGRDLSAGWRLVSA